MADITTNVSRAAVSRYVRVGAVPEDRITYVPNGIDTDRFQFMQDARLRLREELHLTGKFVWLAVGRFEEAKDYPSLLQALRQVVSGDDEVQLLIAGQGTLLENIKDMAHSLVESV